MGGLAATAALAERAGVAAGPPVLDAGSGLGGPARFLAGANACRVQGVDLSPDYVAIARRGRRTKPTISAAFAMSAPSTLMS